MASGEKQCKGSARESYDFSQIPYSLHNQKSATALTVTGKRAPIMKQDILIISLRITQPEKLHSIFAQNAVTAELVNDIPSALQRLAAHTPAFLWIDLEIEEARLLLIEIANSFIHPPPYIILTSSFDGSAGRAVMLDHGADACVECPVEADEILSIINAVLRRDERMEHIHLGKLLPCIEYKELFLDPLRRTVKMRGEDVKLTRKEFDILHFLASHPDTAFTREQIYSHVWKTAEEFTATIVSDHISSIRRKLGLCAKDVGYIQTVFRIGYRFAAMD